MCMVGLEINMKQAGQDKFEIEYVAEVQPNRP